MEDKSLATREDRPQGPIWGDPCPNCGTPLEDNGGFAQAQSVTCPKGDFTNFFIH